MTNLFLVPAGSKRARTNFELTVRQPVRQSDLKGLKPAARKLARSRGDVSAWGTMAGKNDVNVPTWTAMERGDWVLFYSDGRFVVAARVLLREHSAAVAKALWGGEAGETWEYLYLLDEVVEVDIPRQVALGKLGYRPNFFPRKFARVDRDLEADHGSIEQLLEELAPGDGGRRFAVDAESPQAPAAWDLKRNQRIRRKVLHRRFGGQPRGEISPSAQSPNVFVFYDPEAGEQHGYNDEWRSDGCLYYTGEGQHGDQEMKAGNAAILNHKTQGRALRVFQGARGTVSYEGEFELDDAEPVQLTDAPETNNGPLRQVFVFRLRPIGFEPPEAGSKLDKVLAGPTRVDVPIEQQETEKAYVNPSRKPYEAERREQKLVLALEKHLIGRGHTVNRQRLLPSGEARPIVTDLFDATTGTLVEAKGTVERNAIRMAIGQLCDYRRLFDPGEVKYVAALFPTEPRADLCDLLSEQGIVVIHQTENGFEDSTGGSLVNP